MSQDALIGYTGFVGSNIAAQHHFDFLFDKDTSESMRGQSFDTLVCAGAPGTKWLANKEPENDWANIQSLMDNLSTVTCRKAVLISTIDVYAPCRAVNEDTSVDAGTLQPYSKHRRLLEEFMVNHFDTTIIHLPGIFGPGLKKNAIYDLMNAATEHVDGGATMQWYSLTHLWGDISRALDNSLPLLNIATEPMPMSEVAAQIFHIHVPARDGQSAYYDMQTKYHELWGNKKPYLYMKDTVLRDLEEFVHTARH